MITRAARRASAIRLAIAEALAVAHRAQAGVAVPAHQDLNLDRLLGELAELLEEAIVVIVHTEWAIQPSRRLARRDARRCGSSTNTMARLSTSARNASAKDMPRVFTS